jgi:uncharacterized membrane protein YfcA
MSEYWLIPLALLTSTISGFTGLGGGALLMGFMGIFFAPAQLVPLHGLIQLVSNVSRAGFSIKDLRTDIAWRYFVGSVIGAIVGYNIVLVLPEKYLWLSIGSFLLILTWMRFPKKIPRVPFKYPALGGFSTFLSLFIGITGPLVHPVILREGLDKKAFIATEAVCAGTTHLMKVLVFVASGVALMSYWKLLLPMAVASVIGSYLGKLVLGRIRQDVFVWIVKSLVTLLALRMIIKFF